MKYKLNMFNKIDNIEIIELIIKKENILDINIDLILYINKYKIIKYKIKELNIYHKV